MRVLIVGRSERCIRNDFRNLFNPNSRLATGFNMAAPNQTTMERGQQLFSGPGEITFASKGGIMNTKNAFQRVA